MIKSTITISTPSHLSLANRQLIVTNKETKVQRSIPLEEVGLLLLENPMITLTLKMLQYCMEVGTVVLVCDDRYTPSGMLYPLIGHTKQGLHTREQVAATLPLKKSIWKQLVKSKITNQAIHLKQRELIEHKRLLELATEVKSGDPNNREGTAARIYWSALFGGDFIRKREGTDPNALFNYAYSILRASVARSLVSSGLSPKYGVQHKSQYNAFPLADDMMEPFRPFADISVMELVDSGEVELSKNNRNFLKMLLVQDALIGKVKRPLQLAIASTTASLAKVYLGEARQLVLPRIP